MTPLTKDELVERMADAIDLCEGSTGYRIAVEVLKVIESSGIKIMGREPTDKMCHAFYARWIDGYAPGERVKASLIAAFDAAPTYSEE